MFTQEEVNELVGNARKKARDKYKDYDEMKEKAEKYDSDFRI